MPLTDQQRLDLKMAAARMDDATEALLKYALSSAPDARRQLQLAKEFRTANTQFLELLDCTIHPN